jgi:hypothetical protein
VRSEKLFWCRNASQGNGILPFPLCIRFAFGSLISTMKISITLLVLAISLVAYAELPFKLPPKAKYTPSDKSINKAKDTLSHYLVSDADVLTNLFAKPMVMCGPGLWNALKDSPHFSKPPKAKSTARIPLPDGKAQELPMALLQTDDEVASFRKAFAELLASQGKLTIRDPKKDEFMVFWAVIPFDEINDPLLVAEGKNHSFICLFQKKGGVFWADEVKKMNFKKE